MTYEHPVLKGKKTAKFLSKSFGGRHRERKREGWVGGDLRPVCHDVFYLLVEKNNNTVTSFQITVRLACEVCADSDALEKLTQNVTETTVVRSHSIIGLVMDF